MILEEYLAKEFISVIEKFYPGVGELIRPCYVKVVTSYWGHPPNRLQHVAIYCPEDQLAAVKNQKDALKEVAQQMGLAEVICISATRLLRDPRSSIKQSDPRFWLELHWVTSHNQSP
ncbi:MAG TPA: hypothetical protein V6C78_25365 [Crinalium sp.]